MKDPDKPAAVGIDLGTSFSRVACMQGEQPVVLADARGRTLLPSVVSFSAAGETAVGWSPGPNIEDERWHVVREIKRLAGKDFRSTSVQHLAARHELEIVAGPVDAARVLIGERAWAPEELMAMIISKLKAIAETHLPAGVDAAVVAVPACFGEERRQAVLDACEIAELEVLALLSEPTASALAYAHSQTDKQRIAVYDLGGGILDVSIVRVGDGICEVMATQGNATLGGIELDAKIVELLLDTFYERTGIDLSDRLRLREPLRRAAERGKIGLSTKNAVDILVRDIARDGQGEYHDLRVRITRAQLASIATELLTDSLAVCDEVLRAAGIFADDLDGLLLIGGSTKLPFVKDAVTNYFEQPPIAGIDPNEAVAMGAALKAAYLRHETKQTTAVVDVTPMTLQLATVGGYAAPIVVKNTPLPASFTREFTTANDHQRRVDVTVLQGESNQQSECMNIGSFEFSGFRSAPRGEVVIEVNFKVNEDGMLHVSASEKESGRQASMEIPFSKTFSSGMTQPQIELGRRLTQLVARSESVTKTAAI